MAPLRSSAAFIARFRIPLQIHNTRKTHKTRKTRKAHELLGLRAYWSIPDSSTPANPPASSPALFEVRNGSAFC